MNRIIKISMLSGANAGAILGVVIALMLDFMTDNALGGGWRESVQHDIGLLFGAQWAEKLWLVYTGVVVVIGMITAIGAILGAIMGALVGAIFSKLVTTPQKRQ